MARCKECGEPIAPQAMLGILKEMLNGTDTSSLDLCNDRKIKTQSGLVRR